ncbi:MAG: glycosyltransferase [Candidatus Electrothrix sp. AW5]|nr:glycosyltransferase [Candidatus Electrothrix gigas]
MRAITLEEMIELSPDYSTTRLVTRERLVIEEPPDAAFETVLFLPEGEGRQGEGGLRTQGYFKRSLPEKPLITVITVVFNGAQYLEKTIQSVIGQTYDNVEYIIIDGGSTDGTLDIIRKYEHAIDYWVSEKDEGIYDAMNKGITLSLGKTIGIINSDDWYELSTLNEIGNNREIDKNIFHGDMNIYKDDAYYYTQVFPGTFKKINKGMILSHPAMFVGRSIYKTYGYFDTSFRIAADWDLVLRLYKSGCTFHYKKQIFSNFRIGGTSYQVDFKSSQEKSAIRKKNNIFCYIDRYLLIDYMKILILGKHVSLVSLIKRKFFPRVYKASNFISY